MFPKFISYDGDDIVLIIFIIVTIQLTGTHGPLCGERTHYIIIIIIIIIDTVIISTIRLSNH